MTPVPAPIPMAPNAAPDMTAWESAWAAGDPAAVAALYAPHGTLQVPRRAPAVGPAAIAAVFAGGVPKLLVRFRPDGGAVADALAWATGEFADHDRATEAVLARGRYVVVWARDPAADGWVIVYHTWTTLPDA